MLFGQFVIDKLRSLTVCSIYRNIYLLAMSLGVNTYIFIHIICITLYEWVLVNNNWV